MIDNRIVILSVLATAGLAVMWWTFWRAVSQRDDKIQDVLASPAFFRTVVVMGVIAATVVLSLAGRLDGGPAAAILSGIVGFVLGQVSK